MVSLDNFNEWMRPWFSLQRVKKIPKESLKSVNRRTTKQKGQKEKQRSTKNTAQKTKDRTTRTPL